MDRVRFITHAGRRMLFLDFSGFQSTAEALRCIGEAREFISKQPKGQKFPSLVYAKDSRFDNAVVQALKELAAFNRPWVCAGAVAGLSPLHRVLVRVVNLVAR